MTTLEQFDVIIIDVMLPGISGIEVCSRLRKINNNNTPILILSALNRTEDIVNGLSVGADDYLEKPFNFDELIARLLALSRRSKHKNGETTDEKVLSQGNITLDLRSLEVTCAGEIVVLTTKERVILQFFLNSPEVAYSRERILNSIWGVNEDPLTNIIDVYIARLRKKLSKANVSIETIRGAGYKLATR